MCGWWADDELKGPGPNMMRTNSRYAVWRCARGQPILPAFDQLGREGVSPNRPQTEILDVTEQEIESKVMDIVAEQMSVDKSELTRETSFINDLNADSLDTVELVMEFEDEFETSIPDDKAEQIKTVGEAVEFIVEAKKAASSA